jgi:hypothetical protein
MTLAREDAIARLRESFAAVLPEPPMSRATLNYSKEIAELCRIIGREGVEALEDELAALGILIEFTSTFLHEHGSSLSQGMFKIRVIRWAASPTALAAARGAGNLHMKSRCSQWSRSAILTASTHASEIDRLVEMLKLEDEAAFAAELEKYLGDGHHHYKPAVNEASVRAHSELVEGGLDAQTAGDRVIPRAIKAVRILTEMWATANCGCNSYGP